MVDNTKLHDIDQDTAKLVTYELEWHNYAIKDVSRWIKRSYGYAYARLRGQDSFCMNDLETIALHLGYTSIFDFIDAQKQHTYGTARQKDYSKVASQDNNRDAESETPVD